jgi:hypothetical protein
MRQLEGLFPSSPRMLRQFAGLWLFVFGLLAYLHGSQAGLDRLTGLWIGLAASVGLAGLVWPRSIRLIYLACVLVTFPLGWCVSQALVALIFWGLFTPLGLIFRLRKRDPLQLRRQPDRTTYWTAPAQPLAVRDYFRQY